MAAILTRLRRRDTQAFMDDAMEEELIRIAEEIKQGEERGPTMTANSDTSALDDYLEMLSQHLRKPSGRLTV